MTISEYMNNLALESASVANEMACDAILCDLYSMNPNYESDVANESLDLAFDDEDDVTYYAEPATEAGFFKSLGDKFKNMVETVKQWFIKIGKTIAAWIKGFIDRIKSKITGLKNRHDAIKNAALDADIDSENTSYSEQVAKLNSKKAELNKIYTDPNTPGNKKSQVYAEMQKIDKKLADLKINSDKKIDNLVLRKCKIVGDKIANGIRTSNAIFNDTSKAFDTIETVLLKIEKAPTGSNATVGDIKAVANNSTADTLKGANIKDHAMLSMFKKVEGVVSDLTEKETKITNISSDIKKDMKELETTAGSATILRKAIEACGIKMNQDEIIKIAKAMQKTCEEKSKATEAIVKIFDTANTFTGDAQPIAEVLRSYTDAAKKIVSIVKAFLEISTNAENFVLYSTAP